MKRTMIFAIVAMAAASCQKENPTPGCSNTAQQFHTELQGTYKQVGFKTALFDGWSYTDQGPQFVVGSDTITEPFSTKYQVIDANTIYLQQQHQTAAVTFGDTIVWAFQDGDSLKLLKL